jgi:hypothetical protein
MEFAVIFFMTIYGLGEEIKSNQNEISNLNKENIVLTENLKALAQKHNEDFTKLAGKHSAAYARNETHHQMQQTEIDLLNIRVESILNQLEIIREGK